MFRLAGFLVPNRIRTRIITGSQRELERKLSLEMQDNARNEIFVIAGELDDKYYNKKFAGLVQSKLNTYPNFSVKILFSKDVSLDKESRLRLTYEKNTEVCKLLKDGAFGGRLSMYLSEERPKYHFGIADNLILIERLHNHKEPRDVLFVNNYTSKVAKYKRYFEKKCNKEGVTKFDFDRHFFCGCAIRGGRGCWRSSRYFSLNRAGCF